MTPTAGTTLNPLRISLVSRESMRAWAVFLHDPNPIHLDAGVVKAKGLGDKEINQGPTNVGYIITMLQRNFPGATLAELDSRFLDNVYADDNVIASGTVTSVNTQGGATRVDCDIALDVEGRGTVISGTASLIL